MAVAGRRPSYVELNVKEAARRACDMHRRRMIAQVAFRLPSRPSGEGCGGGFQWAQILLRS